MASAESVSAIKAAITAVYSQRTEPGRVTKGAIIAAAGVSQKTFYRVLEDHQEVVEHLALAESMYHGQAGGTGSEAVAITGPTTDELLVVIASLAAVVEEQQVRLRELQRSLDVAVSAEASSVPAPPSLSAARKRLRDQQAHPSRH